MRTLLNLIGLSISIIGILTFILISKNNTDKKIELINSSKETLTLKNKTLLCEVTGQYRRTTYKCYIKEGNQKYLIGKKTPWMQIVNLIKESKDNIISQSSIIKVEDINITFDINKNMNCIFNPFYEARERALVKAYRKIDDIKKDYCLSTKLLNLQ